METIRPAGTARNERIVNFSDAVFAIVITLLVLELKVPEIEAGLAARELPGALFALLPKLLAHVIAFAVLGIYWIGHHTTFLYIKRHDRVLLWLNILLLMFVSLMPFPAALLSRYPDQTLPMVVFCSLLILTGIVADIMWWYATAGGRLTVESITPEVVSLMHRRMRIAPVLYLLAIAAAFFSLVASNIILLVAILFYIVPNPLTDPHRHHRIED